MRLPSEVYAFSMDLTDIFLTLLLLAPPVVMGVFWRASLRRRVLGPGELPDAEALILARVCGIACGLLPALQLGASIVRYKTGEPGLYLWYLVPAFGLFLAVAALAAFLAHARGSERKVSSSMVLVAVSMLLLITFVAGSPG